MSAFLALVYQFISHGAKNRAGLFRLGDAHSETKVVFLPRQIA